MTEKPSIPAPAIAEPERMKLEDVVTPIFDFEMGQRLALMRMNRLLKQSDLALMLGLQRPTLGMIELGKLSTPQHPFSVSKMESVFGPRAMRFILLGRYRADYDIGLIHTKYQRWLMAARKPRTPGEHWTHRRLRAGLDVRGTFQNVSADDFERARKILEESVKKNTNSIKRKDKKPG